MDCQRVHASCSTHHTASTSSCNYCGVLWHNLRLRATQEHNERVERYDAGADAWSVVELAPGAEPFKRAFMSCCVL